MILIIAWQAPIVLLIEETLVYFYFIQNRCRVQVALQTSGSVEKTRWMMSCMLWSPNYFIYLNNKLTHNKFKLFQERYHLSILHIAIWWEQTSEPACLWHVLCALQHYSDMCGSHEGLWGSLWSTEYELWCSLHPDKEDRAILLFVQLCKQMLVTTKKSLPCITLKLILPLVVTMVELLALAVWSSIGTNVIRCGDTGVRLPMLSTIRQSELAERRALLKRRRSMRRGKWEGGEGVE